MKRTATAWIFALTLVAISLSSFASVSSADLYNGGGAGPGISTGGGSATGGGGFDVWDIRNLTYRPYWKQIDIKNIKSPVYCGKWMSATTPRSASIIDANGNPFPNRRGVRDKCARRLAYQSMTSGAPLTARKSLEGANALTNACMSWARAKRNQSICWYHTPGVYDIDSDLHQPYQGADRGENWNERVIGLKGVLAYNIVVWRYDTLAGSTFDERKFRNPQSGDLGQMTSAVPIFQRRIAAYPDGGSHAVKYGVSADEGGCSHAYNVEGRACLGPEGDGDFPYPIRSSHRGWWWGGAVVPAGMWNNMGSVGGPLEPRGATPSACSPTGNSDAESIKNDMTVMPTTYAKNAAGNWIYSGSAWPDGWTTVDYARRKNGSDSGWKGCAWLTRRGYGSSPEAAVRFKEYLPTNIAGGLAGHAAADKYAYESIAVAWNMGKTVNLKYALTGVPGALYVVQVYGITSRERVETTSVDAFFGNGPVTPTGLQDPCIANPASPGCTVPTKNPDDDGNDTGGDPVDPVDGVSSDLTGDPFPEIAVELTTNSQLVRTGDLIQWDVSAVSAQSISAGQALFATRSEFHVGEPQVYAPRWGSTIDGQKYYDEGTPANGRYYMTSKDNATNETSGFTAMPAMMTSEMRDLRATLPAEQQAAVPQERTSLFKVNQLIFGAAVEEFVQGASLWAGSYVSSALVPSQTDNDPQVGYAGAHYESGRWLEDTSVINVDGCRDNVRASRAGGWKPLPSGGAQIQEGYYYHNADDECTQRKDALTGNVLKAWNNNVVAFEVPTTNGAPAPSKVTLRSRDGSFEQDVPGYGATPVGPGQYAHVLVLPDENLAYQVIVSFPHGGGHWDVYSVRWSDPRDKIQWAGQDTMGDAAIPGGVGVFGPDHDPLNGITNASGQSGVCGGGTCSEYSVAQTVLIMGNQPSS